MNPIKLFDKCNMIEIIKYNRRKRKNVKH